MRDRVGIGWRPDLAAGLYAHLDQIDVVEVLADDYFRAGRRARQALQTLAGFVPVCLHGTSLGMASSHAVDAKRLDRMARLVEDVRPEFWSEHLAFVRAAGVEIGHLAAPPRTAATVEGAFLNLRRARDVVGCPPLVENIATLIDPPGSVLSEAAWIREILDISGCCLLLDLHNVYANGWNHSYDPAEFIRQFPAGRIGAVHLAGGRWIPAPGGRERLLDDHLHDVPAEVYALLEDLAARAPRPLTVILERDGRYPPVSELLGQLQRAREAIARGRSRRT